MTTDHEYKYTRQPKSESRMTLTRQWYAYDSDGTYKGIVTVSNDNIKRHEKRGWTFKPRWK